MFVLEHQFVSLTQLGNIIAPSFYNTLYGINYMLPNVTWIIAVSIYSVVRLVKGGAMILPTSQFWQRFHWSNITIIQHWLLKKQLVLTKFCNLPFFLDTGAYLPEHQPSQYQPHNWYSHFPGRHPAEYAQVNPNPAMDDTINFARWELRLHHDGR